MRNLFKIAVNAFRESLREPVYALMLLAETRPEDEEWREEMEGALEELDALAADYTALAEGIEGLGAPARRLTQAVRTAAEKLQI